ncbi:MAG: hypothetical protein QXK80_01995 [Candidatus Pacearchaeota archaeon]
MYKEKITIKPNYKHRVPYRPTKVHKNNKNYDRKKSKEELKEITKEIGNLERLTEIED